MISCYFSGDGTGPGKWFRRISGVKRDPARGGMLPGQLTQVCRSAKEMCVRRWSPSPPSQVFHPWEELTSLGFALSHILLRAVALDLRRSDYPCFPKALSGSAREPASSAGDPPAL